MEEKNEVLVPKDSESKCGFRMDAKSGLIGACVVLASLGLLKAGKSIKRKVKGEIAEPEDDSDTDDTKEEASKETK